MVVFAAFLAGAAVVLMGVMVVATITQERNLRKPASFQLAIRAKSSMSEAVDRGGYDYANPLIDDVNFPLPDALRPYVLKVELHCFGEEVENDRLRSRLAEIGKRPANMEELLAFGEAYPEEQRRYPVVAPDAVLTKPDGQCFIGCLFEFAGERNLGVIWERKVWRAQYRFLVVSE